MISVSGDGDGNTLISTRGGKKIVTEPTPGILSKDELRPLWVSWFNKTVMVGKGLPMQGVVVTMDFDDEIPVRSIGLSNGAQQTAEWKFSTELGKSDLSISS